MKELAFLLFFLNTFHFLFNPTTFHQKNRSYNLKAGEFESSKTQVGGGRFFAASDRKIQRKMKKLEFFSFSTLSSFLYPTNFHSKIA